MGPQCVPSAAPQPARPQRPAAAVERRPAARGAAETAPSGDRHFPEFDPNSFPVQPAPERPRRGPQPPEQPIPSPITRDTPVNLPRKAPKSA